MAEADGNSFEHNKRHGLIWRDTEGTYHPVLTEEDYREEIEGEENEVELLSNLE